MNRDNLLDEISKYGLIFNEETIFNLFVSLKTKPFIILTGISGSGKSKIAELFSLALAENSSQVSLTPVKPNWNDNKGIFGYHNVLDDSYVITSSLKLMLRALKNPDKPYFLILDEMNIARVENYFADYLSLIESRKSIRKPIAETQSETILYAAIDINKPGEFLTIETYRRNRFSICWKAYKYHGKNWTASIRTELNNSKGRKANKFFESNGGKTAKDSMYKFLDPSTLTGSEKTLYDKIKSKYDSTKYEYEEKREQDNLVLHNSNFCLSSDGTVCPHKTTCPYKGKINQMYQCDKLVDKDEIYRVPPEMPIPWNLFTIGTVNIDETTHMFSPKVLDRANVVTINGQDIIRTYHLEKEFSNLLSNVKDFTSESFKFDDKIDIIENLNVELPMPMDVENVLQNYSDEYKDLLRIYNILQGNNMSFGYRTINEICKYILNVCYLSRVNKNASHALDFQIMQKILPKLNGTYDKLNKVLFDILYVCCNEQKKWREVVDLSSLEQYMSTVLGETVKAENISFNQIDKLFKYRLSASKLIEMIINLDTMGITSFL